jgi:hypothetical protein
MLLLLFVSENITRALGMNCKEDEEEEEADEEEDGMEEDEEIGGGRT